MSAEGTVPLEVLDVLIVDDDFRVAEIHAALVERVPGFRVVARAHTAEQARTHARELRPHLVLMDIYLPDGSGLEVFRSLLDEPEPPDVIVISAARDVAAVRTAMQLGAVHYLVKPFDFALLAERLAAYRHLRRRFSDLRGEPRQSDVDELFRMRRSGSATPPRPNRGHTALTLQLIRDAVRRSTTDVSAAEVGAEVGISRATAQRYLNYLEQDGEVQLRLKYGAGRPENRYHARDR